MRTLVLASALVASLGACKKKPPTESNVTTGSGSAVATGSGSGSAGSGSAVVEPAPKPVTTAELSPKFEGCWSAFNDAKWDAFATCYTPDAIYEMPGSGMPSQTGPAVIEAGKEHKATFPDAKGENQLELISGHSIVAVTLITGTNSGPIKSPTGDLPPTNKKIGLYTSQVLDLDDAGRIKHEWEFLAMGTMMGQLGLVKGPARPAMDKLPMPKQVVIAKDDDAEKANLAAVKTFTDLWNKHDPKVGDLIADDAVWSDQGSPKDQTKKELMAATQAFWKAAPDAKVTADQQWAAGDFVATVGTVAGIPDLAIFQLDKGKLKHAWIFANAAAK